MNLNGKVALVTGATSDMGAAIALALETAGARVVGVGRRGDRLAALEARSGGGVRTFVADLACEGAVESILAEIGHVDILVHNAAHPPELAPFLKGGMETLRRVMEVNFFAAASLSAAVIPGMLERRWGRIIAISSLAASLGEAYGPAYCASKAAMEGLIRNLAIDYSPHGLTANIIQPGPVLTERLELFGKAKARRFALASAVRRLGDPMDVANAVAFLASPQASFITGETLRVDGGLHLGNPLSAMYIREAADGQAER